MCGARPPAAAVFTTTRLGYDGLNIIHPVSADYHRVKKSVARLDWASKSKIQTV